MPASRFEVQQCALLISSVLFGCSVVCLGVARATLCRENSLRLRNGEHSRRPRTTARSVTDANSSVHVEKPPIPSFSSNGARSDASIIQLQANSWARPDLRANNATSSLDEWIASSSRISTEQLTSNKRFCPKHNSSSLSGHRRIRMDISMIPHTGYASRGSCIVCFCGEAAWASAITPARFQRSDRHRFAAKECRRPETCRRLFQPGYSCRCSFHHGWRCAPWSHHRVG